MLLPLPAVNYSSCLSPPPFPSAISPQSCTADHWKVLILKFTQTPNSLSFHAATKPFMQKSHKMSHCAQYTHKKYKMYTIIVRCCFFSQQSNMHTSQHQYICYRKHSFKIRPDSERKTHRGCKQDTILARGPFMQTENVCRTHIKRTKQSNVEKQQTCITTSICSLLETLTYRKHPVHSAAHKLKIRSSRLVLTTAGTDLDSTDRAAMWGS